MTRLTQLVVKFAIPAAPDDVRDEFVVHAAFQLQQQTRLLLAFLFLTVPFAIMAAPAGAPAFVAWGLPLIMGAYCSVGLVRLSRKVPFDQKPHVAVRFVVESSIVSWCGAIVCSLWCVLSWFYAPVDERLHFPLILVMGAFSTAYCLSSIRIGAIVHLMINIVPIAVVLIFAGRMMDAAAGASLLIGGFFQIRMINEHHRDSVNMMLAKRRTRILASKDPLTGLLNRRALAERLRLLDPKQETRLILIDIDHFKTINDTYGHVGGDSVLCAMSAIVSRYESETVSAARIGGEEFALIGPSRDLPEGTALALLARIRACNPPSAGPVTASIGMAEAMVASHEDWFALYCRADHALYAAKHEGRNRLVHAPKVDTPLPEEPVAEDQLPSAVRA